MRCRSEPRRGNRVRELPTAGSEHAYEARDTALVDADRGDASTEGNDALGAGRLGVVCGFRARAVREQLISRGIANSPTHDFGDCNYGNNIGTIMSLNNLRFDGPAYAMGANFGPVVSLASIVDGTSNMEGETHSAGTIRVFPPKADYGPITAGEDGCVLLEFYVDGPGFQTTIDQDALTDDMKAELARIRGDAPAG